MTQISRDAVLKLAQLSSLQLDEGEVEGLRKDIENILDYVEQLNELDTKGVEPAYQVTDLVNISRPDVAKDSTISRSDLLALAPEQYNNHIKVPKVL